MTTLRLRVTALLLLVSTAVSGCGFLLTRRPPAGHENMDYFSCTQSNVGPTVDYVVAGLGFVTAILVWLPTAEEVEDRVLVSAVNGGYGLFFALSGVAGKSKTAECREAKAKLADREILGQGRNAANAPGYGAVQAVSITPQNATIRVGETLKLSAAARGADGQPLATRLFRWTSSNDAIASVSEEGIVTAHAAGRVVIAANSNNLVGTTNLQVLLNPSR